MNNKKKYNLLNDKIPVLSFYSGGGFLDMGFEMAGFEIVWTNENDKLFAQFHSTGITSWRKSRGNGIKAEIFNTKSIEEITSEEIVNQAFPDGKPDYFGIIGGPPCQDFSLRGSQKGFNGDRGKLTIVFINKILELKPAFFVIENVPGLLRIKSNAEFLEKLMNRLNDDYYINHKLLNAIDYGVPQFRERVFFVGINKDVVDNSSLEFDLINRWSFPWPQCNKYSGALKKYKWPDPVSVGKRIKKPKEIPFELCVESCLVPVKKIKEIPNANEYFELHIKDSRQKKINEGETNRPSFKRLHRFKYSPTACYGNNEVHLHPYLQRRISVREALRIQGVPDEYVLPEGLSMTKKFKMIGNGVPVPLSHAVAEALKDFLSKYSNNKQ